MSNLLISLEGISKSYRNKQILKNINLNVSEGDFLSIMGQSGIGKSTLLNIMALFERPDSGKYYFNGTLVHTRKHDVARLRNEYFGFVFQSFNLLNGFSVEHNVAMPLQYASKIDPGEAIRTVANLLSNLGISHLKSEKIDTLSGGEKQRVAIARALVNRPSIIFADEPTGNLDYISRNSVLDILKNLNKNLNVAIIIVTHDPEVSQISTRKLTMNSEGLYEN
ncbi:MAG: ABC transporter ATP-binding protein [Christensenellaceae bacterium]|jgi:putative ABC transport system ATP-binding protein|nr:ABC transporter ATP-binding protein [Christensenellaceae bacterium]